MAHYILNSEGYRLGFPNHNFYISWSYFVFSVKYPNPDYSIKKNWPHKKKSGVSVPLPVRRFRSWETLVNKQTELIPTLLDTLDLPKECAWGHNALCTLTGSNIPPRSISLWHVFDLQVWISQVQSHQKQALANAFLLCHPTLTPIRGPSGKDVQRNEKK